MLLKRINIFVNHSNLSYNKFENSINASRGTISRALKHNKTIGSNVVERILEEYPNLSAEWLLRGKGEMLILDRSQSVVEDNGIIDLDDKKVEHMIDFYGMMEESKLVEAIQKLYTKHQKNDNEVQSDDFLEHFVLRTWEKKYGAELKHINRMLEIFYRERMERVIEKDVQNQTNKRKKSP